jgi:hypothetical protein
VVLLTLFRQLLNPSLTRFSLLLAPVSPIARIMRIMRCGFVTGARRRTSCVLWCCASARGVLR